MHMINHSLTKSMLFLSSGNILQKYNTKQIQKVSGVLKILPVSGLVFLLGLFAITGTPPFSVFSSEITVLAAVFAGKHIALGIGLAVLFAVVFAGFAVTMFGMFFGKHEGRDMPKPGETNIAGTVCVAVLLIAITVTGLYMPPAVRDLLTAAQHIITGGLIR